MDKSARVTSSAVAASQNWTTLEFWLTGAAAGTKASLVPAQGGAAGKVHVLVGNAAADLLTVAQAQELVRPASGQLSAAQEVIVSKLVTWGTDVPAVADGARCIALAVGGLGGVGEILGVEVQHSVAPAATISGAIVGSRVLGPAVSKVSSDALVYATDPFVFLPEADVLLCNVLLAEGDNAPVAGSAIKIKVTCRL